MFEQGPRFLMISNSCYMKNANQQLGVTDVYRLPTRVGSYRLGGAFIVRTQTSSLMIEALNIQTHTASLNIELESARLFNKSWRKF